MVGELTHMRSMCVGVAETGVEHCSPAKNHKVTFLIVFFSLVRKERKGQKEESIDSRLGDADRVCFANRSIPRWRRFIKSISADCIDKISPSVLIRLFIFRKRGHLASLLQREKVAAVGWRMRRL